MYNRQLARSTQDESCCAKLTFARVANRPAMFTKSVQSWVFVTEIYHGEQPLKSRLCEVKIVPSSWETMSADVCLNESLGSYMQQMRNIMS